MTFTIEYKTPEEFASTCELRKDCEKLDKPIPQFCKVNCAVYRHYLLQGLDSALYPSKSIERKDK